MSATFPLGHAPDAPRPGELVTVRGRHWIVSEVGTAALDDDPLRPSPPQHLVTLSSVEDDGLGEELRVLWEIEPGAAVVPARELIDPSGFDDPARLDAFLLAVRWGAISTADVRALQAPFRSGIQVEDYQLEPLVRAVQMPRVSLLVADDVGLGKTVEAGLVVQELLTRHRARSVLVVCPASLQIQWRDQMRDKFGLEFRIVDAALMRDLRRRRGLHVNPWRHFPRLVTSMDFVKRERPLRLLREALPAEGEAAYPRRFDFLIVDEAHNVAPSGRGLYALDSLRTQVIRLLAPHFEHKLFLTATPHNGYRESFTALLEMLDSQRFAVELPPDERQLRAVMVRRLKSDLTRWDGTPRFPGRELVPIRVPYTPAEREIHAALERYAALRRETTSGAGGAAETTAADFVHKLLKKRLFSSPAAFLKTLDAHEATLRQARGAARTASRAGAVTVLRARAADLEEDALDEDERQEALDEALGVAAGELPDLGTREAEAADLLRKMRAFASLHASRADSKAVELLRYLDREIRPGGAWGTRRVLVFTEYLDTLRYLHELLASRGYTGADRVLTLHGGQDPESREAVKAAFQAGPAESNARILLATDAASEGIDLQNHCARLVHYEIPWNPNRLEQRNGRVDRYGQREKALIHHFVDESFDAGDGAPPTAPGGTGGAAPPNAPDLAGDLEFLYRAVIKLEAMERDLFGKVAPVVAGQVEEAMLGRRRALDTAAPESGAESVRRALKFERDMKREIARLKERLDDARADLAITPDHVKAVVDTALALADQPPLLPATLPDGAGPVFALPALRGSWAPCSDGLPHPHTGVLRPLTFDAEVARGRDDVVLAHLNHRLVQMSLRLLRAEVWSDGAGRRLKRCASRLVPDGALPSPAAVAFARLVLVGGDGRRLHEEILTAGGLLTADGFKRLAAEKLDDAFAQATSERARASEPRLLAAWERTRPALVKALETRKGERAASLGRTLEERARREANDVETLLRELERAIGRQVAELAAPYQLPLFGDEAEQRQRNADRLARRLAEIPAEIEHETRAVAARFADPRPQLFPVAVVFLVPRRVERESAEARS